MNEPCPNCKDYAHHNVELEEEIKTLKKLIDDKIQEAFSSRAHGPWEYLRQIKRIVSEIEPVGQAEHLTDPKLLIAVDCLKKLSEMEEPAWIRLDENVKMSVAFYAREALEKINTPY